MTEAASPAVEVQGLTRRFKSLVAVNDITFRVERAEIFGLLGPNGAGKTTTLRILVTLIRPNAGSALVFGRDVVRDTMAVRRLIGYVPQQLSADGSLTGRENVMLFARLYDLPARARKAAVAESLELMGLTEHADRVVATYSGGMVRRLELAQALINRPRLLVLDEPTIGLDPRQIIEIRSLIRQLAGQRTVILSTHILPEVSQICEKVVIINEGRVVLEEDMKTLTRSGSLEEVFLRAIAKETVAESGVSAEEQG